MDADKQLKKQDSHSRQPPQPIAPILEPPVQEEDAVLSLRRATAEPEQVTRPDHIQTLQRAIGNQAVQRLLATRGQHRPAIRRTPRQPIIQPKLAIEGARDRSSIVQIVSRTGPRIQRAEADAPPSPYLDTKQQQKSASKWKAVWSGNDNQYELKHQLADEHKKQRPKKKIQRFKLPEDLTVVSIVWQGNDTGFIYAKTQDADSPADIWKFTTTTEVHYKPGFFAKRRGKKEKYLTRNNPSPPVRLLGGGKEALDRTNRARVDILANMPDIPETQKGGFDAKQLFMSGLQNCTTIGEVADKIYDNVRTSGGDLPYSTASGVDVQTLLSGSISFGVCHSVASAFMHSVNAVSAALGLGQQATLDTETRYLVTKSSNQLLLGYSTPVSNIVEFQPKTGTPVAPYTNRIFFNSHTWVVVNGRVYDLIAGVKGGTESIVDEVVTAQGTNVYQGTKFRVSKDTANRTVNMPFAGVGWVLEEL